ncbi:MAG: hypothetical protein K1X75_00675 [Leptospirales bacterium]|nr:hypothetical protein [Leptospirales bacterium]
MDQISSTSSSEDRSWLDRGVASPRLRWLLRLGLFGVLLWACDYGCYSFSYRYFDKINHLGALEKPNPVWLVGSSHVFWGVEPELFRSETGLSLGMLSVPGANNELRGALVREVVERHRASARLIIIEADVFTYSSSRYPEGAWQLLIGYYHRGLFRDYLQRKFSESEPYFQFYRALRSYTLSSDFGYIGMRFWKLIFGDLSVALRQLLQLPPESLADYGAAPPPGGTLPGVGSVEADTPRARDLRIQEWRTLYGDFVGKVELLELVQMDMAAREALRDPQAQVVLLETPNANCFPDRQRELDAVRAITRRIASANPRLHYLRIEPQIFEEDFSLYLDGSHLSPLGRALYTRALIRALQRESLLP